MAKEKQSDLDKMAKDAQKRLAKRIEQLAEKARVETAEAFAESRTRLKVQ